MLPTTLQINDARPLPFSGGCWVSSSESAVQFLGSEGEEVRNLQVFRKGVTSSPTVELVDGANAQFFVPSRLYALNWDALRGHSLSALSGLDSAFFHEKWTKVIGLSRCSLHLLGAMQASSSPR